MNQPLHFPFSKGMTIGCQRDIFTHLLIEALFTIVKTWKHLRVHQKMDIWKNVVYRCVHAKLLQSCSTLCGPMDYSPPGSSIHGIFQARILEWVAIFFSRDLPHPRIEPESLLSPELAGRFLLRRNLWLYSIVYNGKERRLVIARGLRLGEMDDGNQQVQTPSFKMNEFWKHNVQHGDSHNEALLFTTLASLMAQMVKNVPPTQETQNHFLGGKIPGEGNGNPLQYSCLENPMDRGAWWATVHRVAKSRTQLSD